MQSSVLALAACLTLAAFAPACAGERAPSATAAELPDHDPALAHKIVAEGGLLLDVRTPEEFADKHVEGAINVPVGDLDRRLAEIDKLAGGDKKKPIVVYCQMGGRATQAKRALGRAGYERVTNLGGIADWDRK